MAPRGGRVLFAGEDSGGSQRIGASRAGSSRSPRGGALSLHDVRENLLLGAHTGHARARRYHTLDYVYSLFPVLRERGVQLAGSLSGGEQQMCAIGRGLMSRPRLLMLDEPTLGLAPVLVSRIFETVKAINADGVTVLLVEQNVRQALTIAHRAFVLESGKLVCLAPPAICWATSASSAHISVCRGARP